MANFKEAYDKTMGHEGGYVNDPDDVGGETYKGISRRYHPGWEGWKIIDGTKQAPNFPDNLDALASVQQMVEGFYKDHYWDPFRGDEIPPQELAEEMFDTGVNMGIKRSVKFLQRSLNVLNRNGKLFPDMTDDGVLGRNTMGSLMKYLKRDSVDLLLKIMNTLQANHYLAYMKKSPIQEKYCRGWFERVNITKA